MTEEEIRRTVAKMRTSDAVKAALLESALVDRNPEMRRGIEAARCRQRRVTALKRRRTLTLDEARELLQFCDSYGRLREIVYLAGRGPSRGPSRADLFTLLGECWSVCDSIGSYIDILQIILPNGPAPEMMTEAERAALAALPETVTVYRGADQGVNERGLCWSLERAVAARFPFYLRYRAKHPVLVTATVQHEHIIAVKLDREEAEVITKSAIMSSVTALEPPNEVKHEGA